MILLISPKNIYATNRLAEEATKLHVPLTVLDSADVDLASVNPADYNLLFVRSFDMSRMKAITSLAQKFQVAGKKVVGNILDDNLGKLKTYELLEAHNLPIPKLYPKGKIVYPCIIKTSHGMGGQEVFFAEDIAAAQKIISNLKNQEWLAQEYIDAEYEYKIITVGFKVIPVILKFKIDKETMRPDPKECIILSADGQWPSLQEHSQSVGPAIGWPLNQIAHLAEQSARLTNRELAKVDILQKGDQFYILEVNRWPGLKAFEAFTKYNVAGDFVAYLSKTGK